MFNYLLALVPVGFILVASEVLWYKKVIKDEISRKFIHVLAGVWIAFWPFYLPFDGIFVLGWMALVLLIYSKYTQLFHAMYGVDRKTYGGIFLALAIIVTSYIGLEDWIFTVSILLIALADAAAALIGTRYGKTNGYKVFSLNYLRKSLYGTTAFVVMAYIVILVGGFVGGSDIISANKLVVYLVLPLGATFFENTMPFGLDNLVIPFYATLILNSII